MNESLRNLIHEIWCQPIQPGAKAEKRRQSDASQGQTGAGDYCERRQAKLRYHTPFLDQPQMRLIVTIYLFSDDLGTNPEPHLNVISSGPGKTIVDNR
jgi:hypothetical protein